MVAFNTIPAALRIPFVGVEFDNSKANQGSAALPYVGLMLAQKTATGTGTANTWNNLVLSEDEAAVFLGRDSVGRQQAKAWFAVNKHTPLYLGILADHASGTAAAGSIVVNTAATAAGTLFFDLDGLQVPVLVASGATVGAIAASIEAAFNLAETDLPITTATTAATAAITFNNDGELGNEFKIGLNIHRGQKSPAGVTLTITQLTGGATNPLLTSLIADLGDEWFQIINNPYTDATSLTAIETELASRFGGMRMIDGMSIGAASGSVSTLNALGNTRNSAHSQIFGPSGLTPRTASYRLGAAAAAAIALAAENDPARPFQTLALPGVAPAATKFTDTERNTLLYNGIATVKESAGGVVRLDRAITTYKTNAAGGADESYLDANTLFTLMFLRWSWRNHILSKYPRHKLASDSANVGPGQPVMTPLLMKGEAVLWFAEMEALGLVEDAATFEANVAVVRNGANRLDVVLPPDLMNQLIVTATQIQFRV